MNPVRWKYLSGVFLLLSAAFLASTFILPGFKENQVVTYHGPAVPYSPGNTVLQNTSLSGYYIPPVDQGSIIRVSFYDFKPNSVEISLFATRVGEIAPVESQQPLYVGTLVANSSYTFRAAASQPYGIYVISHNRTTFVMVVNAVYSPFFWLPTYESAAVILTVASVVLLYYYNFTARRWRLEQKAIEEARAGPPR